jgi:hypothetical protein
MQIGKENQFRQQELQNQMMQQQALQQYYQAQAQAEQQRIAADAQEALYVREGQRQRGQAVQNYMTGQPGVVQPGQTTMPQQDSGNIFRDLTAGGSAAIGGQQGYDRLFNGVAPEHVPDALGDLQNAQKLMAQPAGPELSTDAKTYNYYKTLPPALQPEFKRLFLDKQPGVVVNTGDKVESAFGIETGKLDATRNAEIFKDVANASASIPAMTEAYKYVDRAFTGFGANQLVGLARAAGATGFKPVGDKVADTQTMLKLLREQTLAYLQTRALGSGTAISDKDREFMERQSAADITMEPLAIKRIIRINMGVALEKMISTKIELQQQMQTYPEPTSQRQIQGKIDMIDRKLADPWTQYWKIYSQEQKNETDPNAIMNSLFPTR